MFIVNEREDHVFVGIDGTISILRPSSVCFYLNEKIFSIKVNIEKKHMD